MKGWIFLTDDLKNTFKVIFAVGLFSVLFVRTVHTMIDVIVQENINLAKDLQV